MAVGFLSPSPIPQGLTLITKQDFTSATTIDVLGCFSSTYQNYLMTVNISSASVANYGLFQFLSGTTPATSSYYYAYLGLQSNGSGNNSVNANLASSYFLDYNTSGIGLCNIYFDSPNVAKFTSHRVDIIFDNGVGQQVTRTGGGIHYTAAAYTGLRIFPNGGNITGTLRIYGLQNS